MNAHDIAQLVLAIEHLAEASAGEYGFTFDAPDDAAAWALELHPEWLGAYRDAKAFAHEEWS